MSDRWYYSTGAYTPPVINPCVTYPAAGGTATITLAPNAIYNTTYPFTLGPCPYIFGTIGVKTVWIIYTGAPVTPYLVQYVNNVGAAVSQGFFALVTCNGVNFSGSYIMGDGAVITFGP
jgi:hypothetical protein